MISGFVRDQNKKITCKSMKQIDDRSEKKDQRYQKRKNWLFHYECFINILLGLKMKTKDKKKFNKVWGIASSFNFYDQLPSAIMKFSNPDFPNQQNSQNAILQPLEVFEFITQTFVFDNFNPKHKILLKAIESVYLQLLSAPETDTAQYHYINGFHQFMNTQQFQIHFPTSEAEIRHEPIFQDEQLLGIKEQLLVSISNKLFGKLALSISNQSLFGSVFSLDFSTLLEQGPKLFKGGHYLKQVDNTWFRTTQTTKDLQTLIRQIVLIFLFLGGFQVKQNISQCGQYIYLYLYQLEDNLKKLAEKHKLKKKLNLYFIDIFSLEPVDKKFRPLRLNNRLWKPNQYVLSDMFIYLRPQIVRLIEQINYKRIAREVNQNKINPKILQQGQNDIQNDDENLNDLEWMAYYQYLVHIDNEISILRRHYQIESDTAALINQQISPLNLYLARNKRKTKKLNIDFIKSDRYHQNKISTLEQKMMTLMNEYENILDKNSVPNSKLIKITKQEKLAYNYFELFTQALNVANNEKKYLYTFWDRINLHNVHPKMPYVQLNKYQLYTHKAKQQMCWCKYQINELRKTSLFSPLERTKLVHFGLYDLMDVDKLELFGFLNSTFCLNDNYELFGHCEIAEEIIQQTKGFFQLQTQNLEEKIKINFLKPWLIQKQYIIEYFGEKIGLYFSFISHQIRYVVIMSAIQLAFYLFSFAASGIYSENIDAVQGIIQIAISIVQTIWISIFDLVWQRELKILQINQGNSIKEVDVNRKRNTFRGPIHRSIENDHMNSQSQDSKSNIQKQILTYTVILLFILLYSGIVISLIFLGQMIKSNDDVQLFPQSEVVITSVFNYILIFISEQLFYKCSVQMTEFINPLYIKDFESILVIKYFALNFISQLGPFIFLNSFSYSLNLYCKETYCLVEARYTFYSFIVLIGLKNVIKFIFLHFNLLTLKKIRYSLLNNNIDDYIQYEGEKTKFDVNLEENGLIKEYVNLLIINTFIYSFGQLSGFSWLILLVLTLLNMQTLKYKLFHCYQRPWPKHENDLGIYNSILLFVNQFTIIISSSLESFQYSILSKNDVLMFFIVVLMGNFIIQFIVFHLLKEPPDKYQNLQIRQRYLIKSTIETFQNNSKHQNKQAETQQKKQLKTYPIYKCWGVTSDQLKNKMKIEKLETISSQSEIEDCKEVILETKQPNIPVIQPSSRFSTKVHSPSNPLMRISQVQLSIFSQYTNRSNEQKYCLPYLSRRHTTLQTQLFENCQKNLEIDIATLTSFNTYPKQWTNLRLLERNVFMRRKSKLLQNLEMRRNQILQQNQKTIKDHVNYIANKKFKKQLNQCNQKIVDDDKNEMDKVISKKNRYIKKQLILQSRKVIVIKLRKAILFSQFRKQHLKKQSLQIIKEIQSQSKILESIANGSCEDNSLEQLFQVVDFSTISQQDFYDMIDELIIRSKPDIAINIPFELPNYLLYYSQSLKSQVYQQVIEKFYDTFIFHKFEKYYHIFVMKLFEDELLQINNFQLMKHINHQFWSVQFDDGSNSLMQFLQVKYHEKVIKQQNIDFHLGVSTTSQQYFIKEANLVDLIDDFFIKGYVIIFYKHSNYITLAKVIQIRKKFDQVYTEKDLLNFFQANYVLMLNGFAGDFNVHHYFLNNENEYFIHNPIQGIKQTFSLITVVLQMATLNLDIDNIQLEISSLQYPLLQKALTMLIDNDLTLAKFHKLIEANNGFKESFSIIQASGNLLTQNQNDPIIISQLNFQLNINFRLKQYQFCDQILKKLQPLLLSSLFHNIDSGISSNTILLLLIEKIDCIISESQIMDYLTNYFYCEYIKMAVQLQTKEEDFLKNLQTVIAILKEFIIQLNQITSPQDNYQQCSINFDYFSQQWLQHEMISDNSLNDIFSSKRRIHNHEGMKFDKSKNIHLVERFTRKLTRFLNQLLALQGIYHFYEGELQQSLLIYEQVISTQIELIQKEKTSQVIQGPEEDRRMREFNFDQQSPELNQQPTEDQIINNYIKYRPSYCQQAIIYKYLSLLVIHDLQTDDFQESVNQFMKLQSEELFHQHLILQLKIITDQNFEEYYPSQNLCLIQRLSLIYQQKFMENYGRYSDIDYDSADQEYVIKQVLNLSLITPNLRNRTILFELLNIQSDELKIKLLKIKSIQLILHMDNYISLSQLSNIQKLEVQIDPKFMRSSLISQLKQVHTDTVIPIKYWFYSQGAKHFRYYHLLSICFAFCKKHVENVDEDNNLLNIAKDTILKLDFSQEYQFYLCKACQILQCKQNWKDESNNQQIADDVKYSILNSQLHVALTNKMSLKLIITKCYGQYPNFIVCSSVILLSLIIYLMQSSYKELSLLLIKICQRLLVRKTFLLSTKHIGFEIDLQYLELLLSNQQSNLPKQIKYLFSKTQSQIEYENYLSEIQHTIQKKFYSTMNEKNIEIFDKILVKLAEPSVEYENLQLICQLLYWINSNLIDPADLDFLDKLLTQNYNSSILELIIKHEIVRYFVVTKRYAKASQYSQYIIDLICAILGHSVNINKFEDSYILQQNQEIMPQLYFGLSSKQNIILRQNQQDLQYYYLLSDYFKNEILLNHFEIQIYNYDEQIKLHYFFLLFSQLNDNLQLSIFFKLFSRMLYQFGHNIVSLEQQLKETQFERSCYLLTQVKKKLKQKIKMQKILKQFDYEETINIASQVKLISFLQSIYSSFIQQVQSEALLKFSFQCAKIQKKFMLKYKLTLEDENECNGDIVTQILIADNHLLFCQNYLQMNDLYNATLSINEAEIIYSMMTKRDPSFSYFLIEQTKYRIFYFSYMMKALQAIWKEFQSQLKYVQMNWILTKILNYNFEIISVFSNQENYQHNEVFNQLTKLIEQDALSQIQEIDYSEFKTYYIATVEQILLEVYTTFARIMHLAESSGIFDFQRKRLNLQIQELKSALSNYKFIKEKKQATIL